MNLPLSILRFRLSVVLVVIFTVVYFIDAANLDDLLPDTVVFHPEANDEAFDGMSLGFTSDGPSTQKTQPAPNQCDQSNKPQTLRIVIDQDSPSLAPEPLISMVSSNVNPEEPIHIADSFTSSSSLYLLNCTLLI